ncbi:vomeronasal type-2 receptor 26-like, partial [Podarcis lilfordi]
PTADATGEHGVALSAVRCYNCGQTGHLQRNCKKPRQSRGAKSSSTKPQASGKSRSKCQVKPAKAMMAKGTTPDVGNSFIIDTGATVHMCPHRGLFSTLKKQSFTVKQTKKVDRAFQRVYADVIGPLEPSRGGARFYLLCVDCFTNYSWVYMMEKPQETLEKFQEFCDKVKSMHDANIDCLFTDEKQIFLLQKFQKFLDGKGIDHKVAVSQEAWNRGVCVKVNKELQKGMNAQLLSSHLPHEYWAESLASYLHVWLRKVSTELGCSPFEKLFNRKPSVAYFKVFGSHVRTEAPGGVKNARGIFVGYEKGLYRVILSESGQVILTKFLESAPKQERIVQTFPTGNDSDDDDDEFDLIEFSSTDDDSESSESSVVTVIERKSHTMDRPSQVKEEPLIATGSQQSPKVEPVSTEDQNLIRRSERATKGVPPKRYSKEFANLAYVAIVNDQGQLEAVSESETKAQQRGVNQGNAKSHNQRGTLVKPVAGSSKGGTETTGECYKYNNCLFSSLDDALLAAHIDTLGGVCYHKAPMLQQAKALAAQPAACGWKARQDVCDCCHGNKGAVHSVLSTGC